MFFLCLGGFLTGTHFTTDFPKIYWTGCTKLPLGVIVCARFPVIPTFMYVPIGSRHCQLINHLNEIIKTLVYNLVYNCHYVLFWFVYGTINNQTEKKQKTNIKQQQ